MKLFHLSDLHLGKRLCEQSLLEDQREVLRRILAILDDERPDAVLIAGDVYDKPVPPAEAVQLFDEFLAQLAGRQTPVFVISGNHDSPERIAFGGRLMRASRVYMAPVYDGRVEPVTLTDEYGPVDVYLLPFVKPAGVRRFFPEREIAGYTDAIRAAVEAMAPDPARRSVLVTHQFVTGAARCDSEELSVGGSDNVDAAVFDPFDYVALGHLHGPQAAGRPSLRYCGSPLKYSFSEAGQTKSVTVVELAEKGQVAVRTRPLTPRRELVELRGRYEELTLRSFYEGTSYPEDYLHITLTDEEDIPDAVGKLRVIYHNLLRLDYDNARTRAGLWDAQLPKTEQKTPLELFAELYEKQNGQPMSEEQTDFMRELIETVWEGQA